MADPDPRTHGDPSGAEFTPPAMSHAALFWRFLRFGATAFGGPVAQIATIRRELVDGERWIGSDRFNRLLAVMQALPGPEAHELCVHLGIRAKGRVGGVLAGLGFMLPGLVLMLALAWAYSRLPMRGTVLPAMFVGAQAAVVAIVLRAVHRIGEHILLGPRLWAAAVVAAAAALAGIGFWIVLPATGVAYALASTRRHALAVAVAALAIGVALLTWTGDPAALDPSMGGREAAPTVLALFWTGLKGGLLTFGGAYAAIPFVRDDTVGRGWITDAQFLDGLGLSGVLPAPLVIFATFVGWVGGGLAGALAITTGMFLPAFAFSLLFYERLESLTEHRRLQLVLAGVAAGVVGLIAVTFVDIARAAAARTPNPVASALIFAVTLAVLYRWKSKLATPVMLAVAAVAGGVACR
ncbi:chromate efflux transporter [uncultured Sphingomonas sp.]|uniref:chromate efflux transporter n=1 Tax=uncultured Sphingomonas sp. TaxID=158754 RepID=UPI0035CC5A9A